MIRKKSNEFKCHDEGTAFSKTHSECSCKKGIPKFFDLQAIINNDSSKSFKFIIMDMSAFDNLVRQVEHDTIRYFLYTKKV